jgi:hypothetical protein
MRMKLIEAIKVIEESEKREHMAVSNMQKTVVDVRKTNEMKKDIVHVQSVLLQEDVIALKKKTRESSVKEAISKAVDYYLKFGEDE